ncbi:MAG: rhodanese-like domain-containing protein [Magnetococcales bacterium]|nr:rhodanese-like domain-containing protein [Magnetococcales bacterium]
MSSYNGEMTVEELLADPATPIIIDVRGSTEADPAIPGSKRVYLLNIDERTAEFEKRFASHLAVRPLLIYCGKGGGSSHLQKQFSGKYRVQSLQGGMVAYLTTISRLLFEHPYENSLKRGETMAKILAALTNCNTDPETFRKIVERLLRCSPDPKFKKLLRR